MNVSAKIVAGMFAAAGIGLLGAAPANAATVSPGPGGPITANAEYEVKDTTPHPAWSAHRVAVLQESLNSTGANLKVDGEWGPATAAALRAYQRQNGLKITGTIDTATMARLDPIG
jgi:peptidoglycan hydrolase-like protein with peptidoglycan-binding domain